MLLLHPTTGCLLVVPYQDLNLGKGGEREDRMNFENKIGLAYVYMTYRDVV